MRSSRREPSRAAGSLATPGDRTTTKSSSRSSKAWQAASRNVSAEPHESRIYADTGPLHERVFAKHAGLGWLGKNTLLLNSKLGSWFFLGVILTTLDIPPTLGPAELPPPDLCGSCTKCIDACPTDALVEPYVMDARLCISYLTIELRGSIPEDLREPMGRHVFGCDICQDVCPWNRRAPSDTSCGISAKNFSTAHASALKRNAASIASPRTEEESLFLPRLEWLAAMNEEQFRDVFRGSPIKRTKWRGLVRNACIALGNSAPAARLGPSRKDLHTPDAALRLSRAAHRRICPMGSFAHPITVASSQRFALLFIGRPNRHGIIVALSRLHDERYDTVWLIEQYVTVGWLASLLAAGDPHESPEFPGQYRDCRCGIAWSGQRRFCGFAFRHRVRFCIKSQTGGKTRGIYRPTVALLIRRTRTLH